MEIKIKKLTDLKPAPYNPRTISDKAMAGLRASIERFGLVEPIVFNKRTGNVIGGHQRLKVLHEQGVKRTQVVVVDLTKREEKALNITLNNPHVAGEFVPELQNILEELKVEIPDVYAGLNLELLEVNPPDYNIADEWKGMPGYENEDLDPHRKIIISFANEDDVQAFSKLIEQKITPNTKSLWYPKVENVPIEK